MMVLRCDRCGKDIDGEERRYRLICKTQIGENHRYGSAQTLIKEKSSIDMCENCMFELWGWLKMENHTRRVSDPMEDDCK